MGDGALDLTGAVREALINSGADAWAPGLPAYPSVVAHHPRCGLIVIDVLDGAQDGMVALNRRVAALRD